MENFDIEIEKKDNEIAQFPSENASLDNLQSEYLQKQVEEGHTISEIANDFAKAKITSEIIKDEEGEYKGFHKELAKEQKETLKESFVQDKVRQQTETLSEKQKKAEAFYISFRPILEFDFSHLVRRKEKEEKQPKQYKERSYGIPLMVLMLFLLVVPYCVFSIILALFNGINSIFEAIATFGSVARVIAMSIFIIVIMCLVVYFALLGIDALFGVDILAMIGL